ncbi:hypothetical protein BD289DRAFT_31352 [Coniella lustricola]|uniref:Uncharacterized protein n=1 Tax=Coniella lustricola TaxID=2025994 RepID=A0A2T3A2R2_9PEZI|nr:hypothetical protein BD289DRAFT_31352 [Coniella lustricola]
MSFHPISSPTQRKRIRKMMSHRTASQNPCSPSSHANSLFDDGNDLDVEVNTPGNAFVHGMREQHFPSQSVVMAASPVQPRQAAVRTSQAGVKRFQPGWLIQRKERQVSDVCDDDSSSTEFLKCLKSREDDSSVAGQDYELMGSAPSVKTDPDSPRHCHDGEQPAGDGYGNRDGNESNLHNLSAVDHLPIEVTHRFAQTTVNVRFPLVPITNSIRIKSCDENEVQITFGL